MDRKRVGIVLFKDVEVLDFCGPFEVFSATRLNEDSRREEPSPFDIKLVAEKDNPVVTAGGMKVLPDYVFEKCPKLDILVVPGGWGVREEMNNMAMLNWLCVRSEEVETLSSVCTGSILLGKAGLLDGLSATTHWSSLKWMCELFPDVTVEHDKSVVEEGRIITSAGISAGIDMALRVVGRYYGEDVARATAKHMEYPYPEDDARRINI